MANPTSDPVPIPAPTVACTSVDEYLRLLADQACSATSILTRLNAIASRNEEVPVGVDVVLHTYLRGEDGVLRRARADAAFRAGSEPEIVPELAHEAVGMNTPTFGLVRVPQTRKAGRLLAEWAIPPEYALTPVRDPFDANLDYTLKSFSDAVRLVPAMLPLANKYAFFGDTAPGRRDLGILWGNYDRILRALHVADAMMQGVYKHVDEASADACVGALNSTMGTLLSLGVVLQPRGLEDRLDAAMPLVAEGMPRDAADACMKVLSAHLKARRLKPAADFTLLFRATRHGMTAGDYHPRVDGKSRVLVLVCGDGFWFGGFTKVGFPLADGTGSRDDDACIMTLTNPHRIPPTAYTINPAGNLQFCVYTNRASFGPQFGAAGAIIVYTPFDASPHHHCNGFGVGVSTASYADTTGKGALTFTGKASGWKVTELLVFQV